MVTHCRSTRYWSAALAAVALSCAAAALPAKQRDDRQQRARPPQWTPDVLADFFEDAREVLVGPRPEYGAVGVRPESRPAAAPPIDQGPPAGADWSKLIDADTLETEIKRIAQLVADDVSTPTAFKAGGYLACRQHFSLLATLFAISAEYDDQARWQDVAPALRDLFARSGYNCKVGTDQTYQESLRRKQELADLVRGSRPQAAPAERAADWSQVADRPPLMQRLETAHQQRLVRWLADDRQFGRHRDDVLHEAQLVAALAEVIAQKGFEYWDDYDYAKYAGELRQAASDISAAVELNDFQQARQAISRATQACANCHEGYRG